MHTMQLFVPRAAAFAQHDNVLLLLDTSLETWSEGSDAYSLIVAQLLIARGLKLRPLTLSAVVSQSSCVEIALGIG